MSKGKEGNSIKIMKRTAADNKYLHKDFHISMNILMDYIHKNFGEEKLIKYLKQYTSEYHKPLHEKMKKGDIDAIASYLRDIYEQEEWTVNIVQDENKLIVSQDACPGISHIKSKGGIPTPLYIETYNTVYNTLCEGTPFEYELVFFDKETGACKQIFKRKETIR